MRRTIVTAFLSVVGKRVAVAVIGVLATPILVRLLGPRAYGEYAIVIAVFSLLSMLATSSVNTGVRKYLAEDRDEPNWHQHVFAYYARFTTLVGFAGAGLLIVSVLVGVVGRIIGEQYEIYFYVLAVLLVGRQFRGFVLETLRGLKLEHASEPIQIVYKLTFSIAAISLVALDYGVVGVLVGDIIASAVIIPIGLAIIVRHIPLSSVVESVPVSLPRRKMLGFSSYVGIHALLIVSLYQVDVFMLGAMVGSEQTGYYKAALVLVEFLWFVPIAIQSVIFQSTAGLWERENVEQIDMLASRATRYALVTTLLLAVGLGILADTFVPLYYGQTFAPAVEPLLLLLPGAIGFAIARPIISISQAKGDMRLVVGATTVAAGLNIVLNALLIPQYGIAGAAVATSIGYGSLPFCHLVAARRLGFRPFSDIRIGRVTLTAFAAGVPIVILARLIESAILGLVLVPLVGCVLYMTAAFVTGALDLTEVTGILRVLPSPIGQRASTLHERLEEQS